MEARCMATESNGTAGERTDAPDVTPLDSEAYSAWLRRVWLEIAAIELRLQLAQLALARMHGTSLHPAPIIPSYGAGPQRPRDVSQLDWDNEDDWLGAYT